METTVQDIEMDGRTAVLARPAGEGRWPGVVMIHEAWGIDDVLRRQVPRLASAGYVVLAPDLLGEGNRFTCMINVARAMRARQGRPFELIQAARQQLSADEGCTGKVGVIGFCMGGGFALLVGNRGFDVSSVNYGLIPKDLDNVLAGSCPVVASYGGRDKGFAKEVPRLEEALTRLGVRNDVNVYPNAGHSFLNDAENGPRWARGLMRVSGVGPEPESARDAWVRIESFFAEHLDSAPGANG